MRSEWKTIQLKDVLELVIDHRGKTPKKMGFEDFHSSGYPVLSAKHVKTDGLANLDLLRFANEDMYKKWMKDEVKDGDIILTSEAPLGELFYISNNEKYLLSQRVFGLRPNKELINPLYLFSWLASRKGQNALKEKSTGSTVQGIKQSELLTIKIDLPPRDIQNFIAKNSIYLADKIINNKKINQTLEQIAQALFKSWFVDFDPVKAKIAVLEKGGSQEEATLAAMSIISGKNTDSLVIFKREQPDQYAELKATAELFPAAMQESELGEIPDGWGIGTIDSHTEMIIDHRGKTPKKLDSDWTESGYPAISAKNIKSKKIVRRDTIRFVDETTYKAWMKVPLIEGDIIMTSEAPMGELYFFDGSEKFCLSQRLFGIRAKKTVCNAEFLFHWLQTPKAKADMEGRASGTTALGIKQAELRKVKVLSPPKILIDKYSFLAKSSIYMTSKNNIQNEILIALRDTLLPKLLSGEITLPEAEKELEEAINV
ncbi:restriction endonuclease subunit S [Providencia manganoxydans]|uniref:restriction endonuclease subunit S n=1 Tax=Providencia manganoxydans TaxID=2923283 RepID=UPI0029C0D3B2|nr:restriction endonuclease subunit S [Providencia manganoxydans]MDX4945937.1 restriction endonuclease subunit S [Providencia manganoxydans]